MSHVHFDEAFPAPVLWGAAALLSLAIGLTYYARRDAASSEPARGTPVEVVEVRFEDRPDGSVVAFEASTTREIGRFASGTSGFVRGVLRGLVRGRRRASIPQVDAFTLTRWADGRLSIEDPRTGEEIDLGAFGATNSAAFARLLPGGST